MSLCVTVWRLLDSSGNESQCVVQDSQGRWQLIVREGRRVVYSERCDTDDAALDRADDLWYVLLEEGWTQR